MIWILLIGVIFYRGAKKRFLPSYLWALIGVGSAVAGVFLGFGLNELLVYISNDTSDFIWIIFPSALGTIVSAYVIMHYYAKKINRQPKSANDDLLDDLG